MQITPYVSYRPDEYARPPFAIETIDGIVIDFDIVGARIVDEGIGGYEYWGAKGVDVQLCVEWDSIEVNRVSDENSEIVDLDRVREIIIENIDDMDQYAIDHVEVDRYIDDGL